MKCIVHILTDEVLRVSEEEAEAIRAKDKLEPKIWQYCAKRFWKEATRAKDSSS